VTAGHVRHAFLILTPNRNLASFRTVRDDALFFTRLLDTVAHEHGSDCHLLPREWASHL
jgi:hypothetical protein